MDEGINAPGRSSTMSLRIKHALVLSTLVFSSCAAIRPLIHSESQGENTLSKDSGNLVEIKEMEASLEEVSKDSSVEEIKEAEEEIVATYEDSEAEESPEEIEKDVVVEDAPSFTLDYKKKHFDFWVKYFEKRENARFLRHIKNGERFKSVVDKVFEEEGLPKELFYVGLIESGYNTHIRSHASAVGPWQFIKGTATRYGLRVDRSLDERRNIHKSTYAAASYFRDLYNIFGSWELALCAYNAGEYRIINAIRRGNTRDYKELVAKKLLPKETIFYIPKVAAAQYLIEKKKMGQRGHSEAKLYNESVAIEMDKSFSLSKFAKQIGADYSTIKKLNPDVKRDWVKRVRRRNSYVYVPTQLKAVAESMASKLKGGRRVANGSSKGSHYKVRRGDSLSVIASRYGTSISQIKRLNNLRRNKIYVGQRLRVKGAVAKRSTASSSKKYSYHKVRRGENLSVIARKYGMSIYSIKRLNRMRSSKILIGQKLKVQSKGKLYTVRRGDNLYRIARKYGLSVNKIVQANSLNSKTIHPNQKIILPI